MGAAESRSLTSTSSDVNIRGRIGFHVLRVADGSPAAVAGIEAYFDYVVGVSGQPFNAATHAGHGGGNIEEMLAGIVDDHEGRQLSLQVWSSKRADLRDVTVVPSRAWSAHDESTSEMQPSLLGLSLRLCNPDGALEKVWHVLEILEGSPAESAGLVPFGDYILGYASGVLQKESDFYELVAQYEDKPLRLFVYNSDFDVTREVVIVPNRAWGAQSAGAGLLGCGIGYGVLHRIPRPSEESARPSPSTTPRQMQPAQFNQPSQQPSSSQAHPQSQQQQAHASSSTSVPSRPSVTSSIPPKRMTASVVPATPPRTASPANNVGRIASPAARSNNIATSPRSADRSVANGQAALGYGKAQSHAYALNPPPRSPSAQGKRSSTAEVIDEEEEELT